MLYSFPCHTLLASQFLSSRYSNLIHSRGYGALRIPWLSLNFKDFHLLLNLELHTTWFSYNQRYVGDLKPKSRSYLFSTLYRFNWSNWHLSSVGQNRLLSQRWLPDNSFFILNQPRGSCWHPILTDLWPFYDYFSIKYVL